LSWVCHSDWQEQIDAIAADVEEPNAMELDAMDTYAVEPDAMDSDAIDSDVVEPDAGLEV
jgi:hypothetical protein